MPKVTNCKENASIRMAKDINTPMSQSYHRSSDGDIYSASASNSTTTNMPICLSKPHINEFPPEILDLIFHFVLNLKPCRAKPRRHHAQNAPPLAFLKDSVTLSHVCSHWRRTAVNTPTLWSHLDIQPRLGRTEFAKAVARWEVYVKRSDQSLLDVHIIDPSVTEDCYKTDDSRTDAHLHSLIETIAPRTQRLAINSLYLIEHGEFLRETLEALLRACVPGVLRVLGVSVERSYHPGDMRTRPFTDERTSGSLDAPEDKLERLLDLVVALDLHGYYPKAGSKAYEGLVELRFRDSDSIKVAESSLVDILKSNPRLRVFEFGLQMTDMLPEDAEVIPVRVDDLEMLVLSTKKQEYPGNVLRWLRPGLKPLTLSMYSPYKEFTDLGFFTDNETQKFMARSNVTKLGLKQVGSYFQLMQLLMMASNVRTLAIDMIRAKSLITGSQLPDPHLLDSLYILRSSDLSAFSWKVVQWFVETHNVRKLTVGGCGFGPHARGIPYLGASAADLPAKCPIVNVVPEQEPNPIEDWY